MDLPRYLSFYVLNHTIKCDSANLLCLVNSLRNTPLTSSFSSNDNSSAIILIMNRLFNQFPS